MNTRAAIASHDCEAAAGKAPAVSVDAARRMAVEAADAVAQTTTLDLGSAIGRVIAADYSSRLDLPPFNASAMDGYAVRGPYGSNEGPSRYRIVAETRAGDAAASCIDSGETVRIFTGASVPTGCDAVLVQEQCIQVEDSIEHFGRVRAGQNVRRRGEDVRLGQSLAQSGITLTAGRAALLAAGGHSAVSVFRRIKVGLLSTGNELREPGADLSFGQIYNSNRMFLSGMLATHAWVEIVDLGTVPDDPALLHRVFREAEDSCDALLTTGGVSAGSADHVTRVMREAGARFDVMKVAMRPGKPLKIGRLRKLMVLGLPGNPVAALVGFRQFALPALRKIAGHVSTGPVWRTGVAAFSYAKRTGRTEFLPINLVGEDDDGRPLAHLAGSGSSASVFGLGSAEAICMLPSGTDRLVPGDRVSFEALY
ncbi:MULTISPECIES: gephyrin-like molybdotransferase Glp [unclassified Aliihoeflea]|uniref:molybdopterin molybdotransferase MoeA n=1 Tax=unclassified Aliihoeflea TaxID=2628764 RepID=UPI0004648301|nr:MULTISPECIES: gephyrin-like molybdotransferase Glp [unclassified Aliihoeflea]MCO6388904.1 molybdopterin molybdenumtransferase MoeA [Aliihoeflea sp. 40Bstr573]